MNYTVINIENKINYYFQYCTPQVFTCWIIGFLIWVITYILIIYKTQKYSQIQIPIVTVPLNLAWELAWGSFLISPLGLLYKIGSSIWFFLDLIIVFYSLKIYFLKDNFDSIKKLLFINMVLFSLEFSFAYIMQKHFNDNLGYFSSYPLNIILSYLYITKVTNNSIYNPDKSIAWAKALGSFFMSLGGYLHYGNTNILLVVAFLVTFILDSIYIIFIYYRPICTNILDKISYHYKHIFLTRLITIIPNKITSQSKV